MRGRVPVGSESDAKSLAMAGGAGLRPAGAQIPSPPSGGEQEGAHGGATGSPVLSRPLPDDAHAGREHPSGRDFEAMSAEEILCWAAGEFGNLLCLTCSWQKQSSALVHMASELGLGLDVVELDTHLFFRETYETRDRLVERYGLNLIEPPRVITVAEQHRREGPNLWERDPDRCCHIRKVEPLLHALEPYDAWISGIRRDQSPSRATTRKIEWSERYGVWKIHPLADWSEQRVRAYIVVNEIPYNPLHDVGYRSIGCIPCTRPIAPGEEERAGRWAGSDKLECGIHLDLPLQQNSTGELRKGDA